MWKINEKIKKIINMCVDRSIKQTFIELFKMSIKYKIIWVLTLPISFLFLIENLTVIIISLMAYFIVFIYRLILNKIFKKKVKNLKYIRRFKFLKNYYAIVLEKILITFPKQKAFLIFYITIKAIWEKNPKIIGKEYIPEFLRSLSNRILIVLILSVPYILIYCNTNLVKMLRDIGEMNYESNEAYIETIFLNIYKDLTNDYNKLLLKLKIKFLRKKIIFNSKKDLIEAIKYKKEFHKSFSDIKKQFRYYMVKQIKYNESTKQYTEEHFTTFTDIKDKIIYINETSSKKLSVYTYDKQLKKFVEKKIENMYLHNGTINEKKLTYYTPNIITEKERMLVVTNTKNTRFFKSIKEEKLNNIIAGFSLNLDEIYYENKKIDETGKYVITENEKLNKAIKVFEENKDYIDKEMYESIIGLNFFWKENEKIIKNLNINEKLELCKELNLKSDCSYKEINFQICKNTMGKK